MQVMAGDRVAVRGNVAEFRGVATDTNSALVVLPAVALVAACVT
jgi:hypothetical protein